MSNRISSSERNFPAIACIVIISALLLYYFLIYVPANETKLKQLCFRTLHTIATNTSDKYMHYVEAIESSKEEYHIKWMADSLSRSNNNNIHLPLSGSATGIALDIAKALGDPFLVGGNFGCESMLHEHGKHYFSFPLDTTHRKCKIFKGDISIFMSNLKSDEIFDDVFLVLSSEKNHIADESKLGLIEFNVDRIVVDKKTTLKTDTLYGSPYYVFDEKIFIGNSEVITVALISKENFDRLAKKIPTWLFIFVLLGLLFIVQLWPLLKLFIVNKQERLFSRDVQYSTFSVVFTTASITLIVAGVYAFVGCRDHDINNRLKALSTHMTSQFNADLRERKSLLDTLAQSISKQQSEMNLTRKNFTAIRYNELFSANATEPNKGMVDHLFLEHERPYFETGNSINVSSRKYFSEIANSLESDAPSTHYIQSIYSRSTGKFECAISRADASKKQVLVITSRLPSVMDPILPDGYGFTVVDPSGAIQFHSSRNKVQNENFFSECDAEGVLRSLVYTGATDHTSVDYQGKRLRLYAAPLVDNWYLITFYEKEHLRTFASVVFSMSLVSLVTLLIYIILLHKLFKLDKIYFKLLQFRPFFFQWLNPLTIPDHLLSRLITFLSLLGVLNIIWLALNHSIMSAYCWTFANISACYLVIYHHLRKSSTLVYHHKRFTFFERFVTALYVIWMMLLFINTVGSQQLLSHAVMILLLTFLSYYFFRKRDITKDAHGKISPASNYRLYRTFLLLCLASLAVFPSLSFFHAIASHENVVRTKAELMQEVFQSHRVKHALDANEVVMNYTGTADLGHNPHEEKEPTVSTWDNAYYDHLSFLYLGKDLIKHHGLLSGDTLHDITFSGADTIQATLNNDETHPAEVYTKALSSIYVRPSASIVMLLVVVVLLLLWLAWWAMHAIPKRIFYLPLFYVAQNNRIIKLHHSFIHDDHGLLHYYWYPFRYRSPGDDDKSHVLLKMEYEERVLTAREKLTHAYEIKWMYLSQEEKIFLYDLAEDGIVNQADKNVMRSLAKQKLIRVAPTLQVCSPVMTDFIMNNITQDDLHNIEQKAQKEGRWNNWKLPLIMLLVAGVGFLSFVEENLVARITGLVASVGLVLTHFVNIGSTFAKFIPWKKNN